MVKWLFKLGLIIAIIFIVIFGIVIFFIIYYIPNSVENEVKEIQCNGIIISIKETDPCFSRIEVKQKNDSISLDVMDCCYTDFFKFTAVGDSIQKEKGSLLVLVTKPGISEAKSFDFPFCIQ